MTWQAARAVLDDAGIKSREKFVLIAIALRAGSDGRAWPSITRVAADTGLSERTVHYALRALVKAKRLTVIHNPGRPSTLTLGCADSAGVPLQIPQGGLQYATETPADTAPKEVRKKYKKYAPPAPTPNGAGAASNGTSSIAARTAAVQRRRDEAANCRRCDDEGVTLDGDGWCKH